MSRTLFTGPQPGSPLASPARRQDLGYGQSPSSAVGGGGNASTSTSSTTTTTTTTTFNRAGLGSGLRVNTDPLIHPLAPLAPTQFPTHASSSRLRSNSTQSNSMTPPFAHHHPSSHQFSRSFSHNQATSTSTSTSTSTVAAPSSPLVVSGVAGATSSTSLNGMVGGGSGGAARDDVALAVHGLRGMAMGGGVGAMESHHRNLSNLSSQGYQDDSVILPDHDEDEEEDEEDGESGEGAEAHTVRRIQEALAKSPDRGDTLDLSRRGISGIGPEAVETFRRGVGKDFKGVWRLALSYNSLTDGSITHSFSKLSRLRYLNLKGNNFTEFPPALSEMNALEILDLSKNRITSFPAEPGRLARLKVLSLTSNSITALPTYLTTFTHLKVFKVDLNPIEWPPHEVLGSLVDNELSKEAKTQTNSSGKPRKDEDLRPWIENMKRWLNAQAQEPPSTASDSRHDDDAYVTSEDDEPRSAVSMDESHESMIHFGTTSQSPLRALSSQQTIRPVRSQSEEKLSTITVDGGQSKRRNRQAVYDSTTSPLPDKALQEIRVNDVAPNPIMASPPVGSGSSMVDRSPRQITSAAMAPSASASSGHSRGSSFTASHRSSAMLRAKKSLPDLRQSHARIMEERREPQESTPSPRSPGGTEHVRLKSQDLPPLPAKSNQRKLMRKGSADMLSQMRSPPLAGMSESNAPAVEVTASDESRNSYFRRLSTLPAASVSSAIPASLLRLVDAIRGILFALSQVHSALRQFLVYAVDDRVSSLFSRVLGPASKIMDSLIDALDRFDSMSRRHRPPFSAIKNVLESAKSSIAVFTKVVGVLKLQVPVLKTSDIRYSRTLLLMIYGSMTEIACSWKEITPILVDVRKLTGIETPSNTVPPWNGITSQKMGSTLSRPGRLPISPIAEVSSPVHDPSLDSPRVNGSRRDQDGSPSDVKRQGGGGVRPRDRRLAGSFSHQDVERGMHLPSPGIQRSVNGNGASLRTFKMPGMTHRPSESTSTVLTEGTELSDEEEETLAAPQRIGLGHHPLHSLEMTSTNQSLSNSIPLTPPEGHQYPSQPRIHAQRGNHKHSSSSGSASSGPNMARKPSVDVRPPTPASAALFDDDLLDLLGDATDTASSLWHSLSEDVGLPHTRSSHARVDSQDSTMSVSSGSERRRGSSSSAIPAKQQVEIANVLSHAEEVTVALRESITTIRSDGSMWNHIPLPDQAQAFIRTVVAVSELVKTISSIHSFSPLVRQTFSRLTQTTRECAILIQVSKDLSGSGSGSGSTPRHGHRSGHGSGQSVQAPPQSARSISPFRTKQYRLAPAPAFGPGSGSSLGGGGGGADGYPRNGSTDELVVPHSAASFSSTHSGWGGDSGGGGNVYGNSSSSSRNGHGHGDREPGSGGGLRGLQLTSNREAVRSRSRTGGHNGSEDSIRR